MKKTYKNVYYNDFVGNIELYNDKLVFKTDLNSVNLGFCNMELPFELIDLKKQTEIMKEIDPMSILTIVTKYGNYKFQFNRCIEDYEEIFSIIFKQIKTR